MKIPITDGVALARRSFPNQPTHYSFFISGKSFARTRISSSPTHPHLSPTKWIPPWTTAHQMKPTTNSRNWSPPHSSPTRHEESKPNPCPTGNPPPTPYSMSTPTPPWRRTFRTPRKARRTWIYLLLGLCHPCISPRRPWHRRMGTAMVRTFIPRWKTKRCWIMTKELGRRRLRRRHSCRRCLRRLLRERRHKAMIRWAMEIQVNYIIHMVGLGTTS